MAGGQFVSANIIFNGIVLLFVEGTTIYDYTFLGFIAYYVAVFHEHIAWKLSYF